MSQPHPAAEYAEAVADLKRQYPDASDEDVADYMSELSDPFAEERAELNRDNALAALYEP